MFDRFLYITQIVVACGNTTIYNWAPKWTSLDNLVYEKTKKAGCSQTYKQKAPCLTRFFKTKDNRYVAICGAGAFNARDSRQDKSIWQFNNRDGRWYYDAAASHKAASIKEAGDRTVEEKTRISYNATPGTR